MYYDLASRWRRFFAALIDCIIFTTTLKFFLLFCGVSYSEYLDSYMFDSSSLFVATILSIGIVIAYTILIPTYVWNGQTIGKYLLRIKVVQNTDETVDLQTMIIRSIFNLGVQISIPVVSVIFGIVALIDPFFIFSSNKKTLHDRIAKTKVIDAD